MGQIRVGADRELVVDLRRSSRARRISLRVSTLDGRVTLTVPRHVQDRVAQDFAEEKSDWIAKALARLTPVVPVVVGASVPVEGKLRRIVPGVGRSARLSDNNITAPEARTGPAVQALLKTMARDRLHAASSRYARELGRDFTKITLRDTRSRWGSCSQAGNLMYSWRLILAPAGVLSYVAAHEVAHLAHMDHSKAFWAVVETLCPEFEASRAWLRREGAGLHAFRFSSND